MVLILYVLGVQAAKVGVDGMRETIRLDKGWKFAMGHASDPLKDFGCGTEYFNYLTKANSIHNEGMAGSTDTSRLGTDITLCQRGQPFAWL